jgi:hypothetical protein
MKDTTELVLTPQQETILKVRLEGAAIFKKAKLTEGETQDIKEHFYAEIERANKEAEAKVAIENKKREEDNEKRRAMMMPSEKQNKYVAPA